MHRLPRNLGVVTFWRLVFSVCELLDGFTPPGLLLQVRWVVAIWQRHRHVCVSGSAWRATCKPSHSESRSNSAHGRKFCMIWFFLVALKLLSDCCLSDCCHCMHVVAKRKLLNVQQCNANFRILKLIHPSIRGEVAASGGSGPQEACHLWSSMDTRIAVNPHQIVSAVQHPVFEISHSGVVQMK